MSSAEAPIDQASPSRWRGSAAVAPPAPAAARSTSDASIVPSASPLRQREIPLLFPRRVPPRRPHLARSPAARKTRRPGRRRTSAAFPGRSPLLFDVHVPGLLWSAESFFLLGLGSANAREKETSLVGKCQFSVCPGTDVPAKVLSFEANGGLESKKLQQRRKMKRR